jgi:hypothetical protein
MLLCFSLYNSNPWPASFGNSWYSRSRISVLVVYSMFSNRSRFNPRPAALSTDWSVLFQCVQLVDDKQTKSCRHVRPLGRLLAFLPLDAEERSGSRLCDPLWRNSLFCSSRALLRRSLAGDGLGDRIAPAASRHRSRIWEEEEARGDTERWWLPRDCSWLTELIVAVYTLSPQPPSGG